MQFVNSDRFYKEIERTLEAQVWSSVYLITGEEPYLVHSAVEFCKKAALEGVDKDFNFHTYWGGDLKIDSLVEELNQLPIFSPRRVVVVKDIHELTDTDWKVLLPALESLAGTHVVILSGQKLDGRKKYAKSIEEFSQWLHCPKVYDNELPAWAVKIGRGHGLDVDSEAAKVLVDHVGLSLFELDAQIQKIKFFIAPRTHLMAQDVEICIDKRKEKSVFDFVSALAEQDTVKAFTMWLDLHEVGEPELGVISLVARHMRILQRLRMGLDRGLSGQRLASFVDVRIYFLKEYQAQLPSWSSARIAKSLILLAETEKALKSSPISKQIWLENLIFKLSASPKS